MQYLSHSPEETQQFARELAIKLTQEDNESSFAKASPFVKTSEDKSEGKALVIALEGELGAGKTTFTQAFAEALGVQEHLKSPTFVLMKHYRIKPTTNNQQLTTLYHLDCYRLRDYKDLEPLGIENILNNPENIILIEWAERVADILPKNHWVVHIDHVAEQERNITIKKKN